MLVLCSHGTRDPDGRSTVEAVGRAVRRARPELDVTLAFVDVHPPFVADKVTALSEAGRGVVVVPVLLSTGYHVRVDVGRAVQPHARAVSTGALGPHPLLADILVDRLWSTGAAGTEAVVLAAAGSSRPALADLETQAALVRARWGGPVAVGFGSIAAPLVADAVSRARADGAERVLVSPYLLAEGFSYSRLLGAGADAVAAPLGVDPRLIDVVLERYDAAVRGLAAG